MSSALTRYRVMAMVVGTMLLVLVLVGMPLQYGAGHPGLADVVAPIHGILYIVYLLAAADLWMRERGRLSGRQVLAMFCAGFLPFLAFFIERRITAVLSGPEAALPPGPASLAPGSEGS